MPRIFEILAARREYWRKYPKVYEADLDLLVAYYSENDRQATELACFLETLDEIPPCRSYSDFDNIVTFPRSTQIEHPIAISVRGKTVSFKLLLVNGSSVGDQFHTIQLGCKNEVYWNFSQRGELTEPLIHSDPSDLHEFNFIQGNPARNCLEMETSTITSLGSPAIRLFETLEDRLTVLIRALAHCLFDQPKARCSNCSQTHDVTVILTCRTWQVLSMPVGGVDENLVEMLALDLLPYFPLAKINQLFSWLTRGKIKQVKASPGLFSGTPIRRLLCPRSIGNPYVWLLSRFHVEYLAFSSTYRYLRPNQREEEDSNNCAPVNRSSIGNLRGRKVGWSISRLDSVPYNPDQHEPTLFQEILVLFCDLVTCAINHNLPEALSIKQNQVYASVDSLLNSLKPLISLMNEKVLNRNNLCNILYRPENYRVLPILATFLLFDENSWTFSSWLKIMQKDPEDKRPHVWPISPPYAKALAEIVYQYTGKTNIHVVNTIRILSRRGNIFSLDDLLSLTYKAKELCTGIDDENPSVLKSMYKRILELSIWRYCYFIMSPPEALFERFVWTNKTELKIPVALMSKWFEHTQSPIARLALLRLFDDILDSQDITSDDTEALTEIEKNLLNICNEPLLLAPRKDFKLGCLASHCLIRVRLSLDSYSIPPFVIKKRSKTTYSLVYEKSAKVLILGLFLNHIFAQSHRPHTSSLIFRVYQICERIGFTTLKNVIEPKIALMVPSMVGSERPKSELRADYAKFIEICLKMLTVVDHPLVEIISHLVNSFMIFPKGVHDLLFFIISSFIDNVSLRNSDQNISPNKKISEFISEAAQSLRLIMMRKPSHNELKNSIARNALFTFKKIILETIESVYLWHQVSNSSVRSSELPVDPVDHTRIENQIQWLESFSLKDLVQTAHICESEARILMLLERHLITPWLSNSTATGDCVIQDIDLCKRRTHFFHALRCDTREQVPRYSFVQWNPLLPLKRELDEYTFVQLWRCLCKLRPTLNNLEKSIFSMSTHSLAIDEYSQAIELGGRVQASNVIRDWTSAALIYMNDNSPTIRDSDTVDMIQPFMAERSQISVELTDNPDEETHSWASLCREITKYSSGSLEKQSMDHFVEVISKMEVPITSNFNEIECLYEKLIPALRRSDEGDSIIGDILVWESLRVANRISLNVPGQKLGGLILQDLKFLTTLRNMGRCKASNLSTQTEKNRLEAMNILANSKGWALTQVWISWHTQNTGLHSSRNMVKLKTWIQNLIDQNPQGYGDILEVASTFCCSRQAKMQLDDYLNSMFNPIMSQPDPLQQTITSVLLQERDDNDLTRLSTAASLCPNFAPARWKLGKFYTDLINTWIDDKMIVLLCPCDPSKLSGDAAIAVLNKKIPYGREPESLKSIARKACVEYIEAAKLDPRLSQIALLRCLSILFQFTSPSADANAHEHYIFSQILCEPVFADFTKEVLPSVLSHVVTVPAPLWYRIVSHLTSRASHKYMGPTLIVPLLTWLFTWFPHHMNWHIQFLINSNRPSQPSVGKQIFLQAEALLHCGPRTRKNDRAAKQSLFASAMPRNPLPVEVIRSITESLFTMAAMDTTVSANESNKPTKIYPELSNAINKIEKKSFNERFVLPIRSQMENPASNNIRGRPLIGTNNIVTVMFDRPSGTLMRPLIVPTLVFSHDDNFLIKPDIVIQTMKPTMDVMRTKQRPKRIVFIGSDGNEYTFLLKNECKGDLRKDSRVQDFVSVANNWLAREGRVGSNQVKWVPLTSFTVILLNEIAGMIEWIPCLETLRGITEKECSKVMSQSKWVEVQQHITRGLARDRGNPRALLRVYCEAAAKNPPMLPRFVSRRPIIMPTFRWFFATFGSCASDWLRVRDRFSVTIGAWSMIGFLVGLGDRHNENILISNLTGELVNVDFDCLFGKGFTLPIPEVVPFRMTHNIVAGFGVEGTSGLFYEACLATWCVLRQRAADCLTWMTSFVYDPLVDWKSREGRGDHSAKQMLQEMDWKLSGHNCFEAIFSAGWVAYTRHQMSRQELLELIDGMDWKLKFVQWSHRGLSPADQVTQVINSSVCPLNLAVMYSGWMAWI